MTRRHARERAPQTTRTGVKKGPLQSRLGAAHAGHYQASALALQRVPSAPLERSPTAVAAALQQSAAIMSGTRAYFFSSTSTRFVRPSPTPPRPAQVFPQYLYAAKDIANSDAGPHFVSARAHPLKVMGSRTMTAARPLERVSRDVVASRASASTIGQGVDAVPSDISLAGLARARDQKNPDSRIRTILIQARGLKKFSDVFESN